MPRASDEIYSAFGEMARRLFAMARRLERCAQRSVLLRDTLLPKLITGEVRLPAALIEQHGGSAAPSGVTSTGANVP